MQSQYDKLLNERMFTMYYRLKDKYKVDIAAIAILAYGKADDIGIYSENFLETELQFKFKTYNIVEEVERGNLDFKNIFSVVIQSVYIDTKYEANDFEKYRLKIKLLNNFLGRKSSDKEYTQLLNFISTFIRLEEELEEETKKFINRKSKYKSMGLKELFAKTIEKEVAKRDRIISKKDKALLEKEEALLEKEESMVINSYRNGISIALIANITNLPLKRVRSILKKNKLI